MKLKLVFEPALVRLIYDLSYQHLNRRTHIFFYFLYNYIVKKNVQYTV